MARRPGGRQGSKPLPADADEGGVKSAALVGMMRASVGGGTAIIGIGRAMTRRGDGPPKTPLQLGAVAAVDALQKAGIKRGQVGALFTGRMPTSYMVLQYNQALLN